MLSPSLRNVPFSGIEWSYQMRDLGYNEKGEIKGNMVDDEDQLVEESKEDDSINTNHAMQDSLHRVNKVADSTLDFMDKEIEI